MRHHSFTRLALAAFAGLTIALCGPGLAMGQTPEPPAPTERRTLRSQSIFGDNFTLRSNETIDGDLSVYGGNVVLEEGSRVDGKLNVFGGNIDIAGTVRGDLTMAGGNARLRKSGRLEGNQTFLGGRLDNDGGYVSGRSTQLPLPSAPATPRAPTVTPSPFDWYFRAVRDFFGSLVSIGLAVLAAVAVIALFPRHARQVEGVLRESVLVSGGLGALTMIAVPVIAVVLAITICLIPASLLAGVALVAAALLGWAVVSRVVGERVMQALNRADWTLLGQTAAGALLLAVLGAIPILGGLLSFLATAAGVGAVVLTRFGTQPYPPPAPAGAVAPVAPPVSPTAVVPAAPPASEPIDPQI
ncbi:MAG: polymer-forming cytoskeletal protein [Thermoflexales bacterium]|nr:polymer-forming cytoskeletal protein [Thermoflexales bacterium]